MAVNRSSRGFTMAELLVAVALMSLVASAVAVLLTNTDRLARAQARIVDTQQRARVIAETLGRDLRTAGAGMDRGAMSGALGRVFTPVWPRRVGRLRADAASAARPDVITLVHVPDTVLQTSLALPGYPAAGRIVLSPCAGGAMVCPVVRGATLAVFEPPGRVDLIGVLGSESGVTLVRPLGISSGTFDAGALVAEVMIRSYYFDAAEEQLRLYDGDGSDQPVVDGVRALTFEYFGDVNAPRWPQPPPGTGNCLYDDTGQWRGGATLSATDDGLAPLPLAMFIDGPWCGAGGTAFDADLLRVRRLRVSMQLRAPDGGGTQSDYRVVLDVTPRNLSISGVPGGEEELC
jgi:prepilin-type N-terminal cleavage/methylation domain-containing protein